MVSITQRSNVDHALYHWYISLPLFVVVMLVTSWFNQSSSVIIAVSNSSPLWQAKILRQKLNTDFKSMAYIFGCDQQLWFDLNRAAWLSIRISHDCTVSYTHYDSTWILYCWPETPQMNVSLSSRQWSEQKIDFFFFQSTCDADEMSVPALRNMYVVAGAFFPITISQTYCIEFQLWWKKWEKNWAEQFGNSPDFCVEPERKESEGRALRKRGAVPTEEEWNKWIWNAIWCHEIV